MKLPYGISGGYYMPGIEPEPPSINKSEFYAKCKQIASIKHLKCELIHDLEIDCKNFYAAKFMFISEPIYAVINSAHPYVAFCISNERGEFGNSFPLDFINNEELAKDFKSNYHVMRVEELNKPFILNEHDELKNVSSVIKQVEYWSPKTIGEVIFNFWD